MQLLEKTVGVITITDQSDLTLPGIRSFFKDLTGRVRVPSLVPTKLDLISATAEKAISKNKSTGKKVGVLAEQNESNTRGMKKSVSLSAGLVHESELKLSKADISPLNLTRTLSSKVHGSGRNQQGLKPKSLKSIRSANLSLESLDIKSSNENFQRSPLKGSGSLDYINGGMESSSSSIAPKSTPASPNIFSTKLYKMGVIKSSNDLDLKSPLKNSITDLNQNLTNFNWKNIKRSEEVLSNEMSNTGSAKSFTKNIQEKSVDDNTADWESKVVSNYGWKKGDMGKSKPAVIIAKNSSPPDIPLPEIPDYPAEPINVLMSDNFKSVNHSKMSQIKDFSRSKESGSYDSEKSMVRLLSVEGLQRLDSILRGSSSIAQFEELQMSYSKNSSRNFGPYSTRNMAGKSHSSDRLERRLKISSDPNSLSPGNKSQKSSLTNSSFPSHENPKEFILSFSNVFSAAPLVPDESHFGKATTVINLIEKGISLSSDTLLTTKKKQSDPALMNPQTNQISHKTTVIDIADYSPTPVKALRQVFETRQQLATASQSYKLQSAKASLDSAPRALKVSLKLISGCRFRSSCFKRYKISCWTTCRTE